MKKLTFVIFTIFSLNLWAQSTRLGGDLGAFVSKLMQDRDSIQYAIGNEIRRNSLFKGIYLYMELDIAPPTAQGRILITAKSLKGHIVIPISVVADLENYDDLRQSIIDVVIADLKIREKQNIQLGERVHEHLTGNRVHRSKFLIGTDNEVNNETLNNSIWVQLPMPREMRDFVRLRIIANNEYNYATKEDQITLVAEMGLGEYSFTGNIGESLIMTVRVSLGGMHVGVVIDGQNGATEFLVDDTDIGNMEASFLSTQNEIISLMASVGMSILGYDKKFMTPDGEPGGAALKFRASAGIAVKDIFLISLGLEYYVANNPMLRPTINSTVFVGDNFEFNIGGYYEHQPENEENNRGGVTFSMTFKPGRKD